MATVLVVAGAVFVATKLSSKETASVCGGGARNHVVLIKNSAVVPSHTVGRRCDRLTITNLDATNRLMAFGEHEHHTPYDGVEEKLLARGQSLRVTLDKAGNYRFHDHLHDEVQGTFTVNN